MYIGSDRQGHLMTVVLLMQHGANADFVDAEGLACIHVAAQFGHTAVIAYFVAKGVDINVQDIKGFTPLMHCACKHTRYVKRKRANYVLVTIMRIWIFSFQSGPSSIISQIRSLHVHPGEIRWQHSSSLRSIQ